MTVETLYTGSSKLMEVVYKSLIINISNQGPDLAFRAWVGNLRENSG